MDIEGTEQSQVIMTIFLILRKIKKMHHLGREEESLRK